VIHRDIKPPNIIRCKDDDRLVLIDFGAVKELVLSADASSCRHSTTQFVGTLGFAPPEQLATRPIYSSDIYALGATCLYLLSGKSPLGFEYEFVTGELRWRNDIVVSEHFGIVLSKMLKVSPQERYQSAQDVLRALELEPYLDNLAYCMNINPKPFPVSPPPPKTDEFIPPIVRTAMSIRAWQAKLQARQDRRDRRIITSSSEPLR
jgi:serine/threonine-protein kinase